MFDRDRSVEAGKVVTVVRQTVSTKSGTGETSSGSTPSTSTPGHSFSRMNSFTSGSIGLSRTLSTPPIADSTHIGSFSSAWNGTSPAGGQSKRRPTSPLLNNRTLFKSSTSSLSGIGRVSSQVLTDARSPGLVNRLVRYYDRSQSQSMNRSQSLSSVYNKPGQFPLVHLRKQELRYGGTNAIRRKGNFSMSRIAPPEKSLFPTSKRSSLLRSGSLLLPSPAEVSNDSLFSGRGTTTTRNVNGPSGGNQTDAENRVITPCAELEATPTRSVLDALKEISRKRINSEELDADRIKKQCQELSELDAAGSGPPASSSAAVAIGTHGLAAKRSREQSTGSSPSSSPSEAGRGTPNSGGGDQQQAQKRRYCVKNNDILSSLSSSAIMMNTPKRIERRLNMLQSPVASMSSSMIGSMPTTCSTLLGPTTPEKFSSMALSVSPSDNLRTLGGSNGSNNETSAMSVSRSSTNIDRWNQAPCAVREQLEPPKQRAPKKLTLFNRPYDTTPTAPHVSSTVAPVNSTTASRKHTNSVTISSDGEEDEHGEGSGKVQFVKPKEKSPHGATLSGSSSGGFSSSRDPLKKPAPSKLTVMLKCLSGDLDDYEEEEEEVKAPEPVRTPIVSNTPSGFSFGLKTNDTVDAGPPKVLPLPTTTDTKPKEPVLSPANNLPTGMTKGLSALINNPIKDAGLGSITTPTVSPTSTSEKPTTQSGTVLKPIGDTTEPKTAPKTVEAVNPLTFTFGTSAATTKPNTMAGTAGFVTPPKATNVTAASLPTATFTFGTPVPKLPTQTAADSSPGVASTPNMISFSPAAAAFGATKLPAPIVQFGSPPSTTASSVLKPPESVTSAPTSSAASPPMFSFPGATFTTPAPHTVATTTSISSPTFGSGSTFGAFKFSATTTQSPTTSVSTTTSTTGMFGTVTPAATTTTSATTGTATTPFTFGSPSVDKSGTAPATIPVFGSASFLSSTTTTPNPVLSTGGTASFTFGNASTKVAPSPANSPFSFGTNPTSSSTPSTMTTTQTTATTTTGAIFPAFNAQTGTNAGTGIPNTMSTPSATVAPVSTAQPFVFGGIKPSTPATTTANLFAAATSATSPASTNLFAATGTTFGAAAQTSTGSGAAPLFGGISSTGSTGPTAATAAAPFTFGAPKPTSTVAANGTLTNSTNVAPGSVFGSASVSSLPSSAPAAPASGVTSGLFTFGSTTNPAGSATQNGTQAPTPSGLPSIGFNMPKTGNVGSGLSGGNTPNSAPFTFGAMSNKPPTASGNAPQTGNIFGSALQTNNNQPSGTASTVPTFGARMNGTNPVPSFGSTANMFGSVPQSTGGPVRDNGNVTNATTGGNPPSAGSIFGGPQTNGPQNVTNNTAVASPGGMFNFGTSNVSNNNAVPTFGGNAGVAAGGSTFGGFNAPSGGGLTNGIGSAAGNKPFTFGASNPAQPVMPQPNVASPATPAGGGFNFNIGSNVAKPFSFTGSSHLIGANANGGNVVASPPMFGSPANTATVAPSSATPNPPPNASPFTFGGASGTGHNATNNNPGPFTFGAASGQQPNAGPPAFNFSAGNVAAVAPQPQQQQQQGAAFTFGAAGQQQQQPPAFGAAPAFGTAPGFGSPAGVVMPTFSIGTSTTPNGPPMSQRRIKVATRRVK